jgi:hypothetical protein
MCGAYGAKVRRIGRQQHKADQDDDEQPNANTEQRVRVGKFVEAANRFHHKPTKEQAMHVPRNATMNRPSRSLTVRSR